MPFIKLRKFLASGLPCMLVLKTCGTLSRLRSMHMQFEGEPRSSYMTLWGHFINLLNLPTLPFPVLWLEKGVDFSFLALQYTPCKCNFLGAKRQEDIQWKQQWGSTFVLGMSSLLRVVRCLLGLHCHSLHCHYGFAYGLCGREWENENKGNFGFSSLSITYRGPFSCPSDHNRGYFLAFYLSTAGVQFWLSACFGSGPGDIKGKTK